MTTHTFPSLIESHNTELENVALDLVHGLKIYEDDTGYIIGDLALSEGASPYKAVNSSPEDLDYRLLARAGLLVATEGEQEPVTITVGFPYSTYQRNRDLAVDFFSEAHNIQHDAATYGGGGRKNEYVRVDRIEVLPEVLGCIIAARNNEEYRRHDALFMGSLGYGTFEACLSTRGGVVQRTTVSCQGIRYAVDITMRELEKKHYLDLRTEHQFDISFQKGQIILNRRRMDISGVRTMALRRYYQDVISPALRSAWKDDDFRQPTKLVLAGGGTMYTELLDCFRDEFGEILDVEVVDDPVTAASRGYCLRSVGLAGNRGVAVGLDVGNAHTALSFKRIGSGGHSEYASEQQSNQEQQPVAASNGAGPDRQPARAEEPVRR
ncbi:MAG: hypothetical protein GVY35_17205 [Bacteroidetes bacterium]|jgi:hypothetical protein|nr:hypothetical protein [Bacteroidota bacterium]